jgi:uncharacterized protein YdaU (DUF1376 family)
LFYYQHHIGDYRRDTGHLTLLEHGIYRQLLDHYYITEKPLDANAMRLVCVRTADECESYARVLADFFIERDGQYFHKRCDHEIDKFKGKASKARTSAKARWNKNNDLDIDANAMRTHSEGNANQLTNKPNNQSTNQPINKDKTKQKKDHPLADMPEGFNKDIWDDFQVIRKAKAAPLTKTALKGIAKQAGLAGITLEDALQECCTRGWQSFRADWITKPQQGTQSGKFNIHAYTRNELSKALEQGMAREVVDSGPAQEVFSDLPSKIHQRFP